MGEEEREEETEGGREEGEEEVGQEEEKEVEEKEEEEEEEVEEEEEEEREQLGMDNDVPSFPSFSPLLFFSPSSSSTHLVHYPDKDYYGDCPIH